MKKTFTKIALVALSALTVLSATACKDNQTAKLSGTELPHYNGVDLLNGENSYDSRLFYRNDLTLFGGDSDVVWVSETQARDMATADADRRGLSGDAKTQYIENYVKEYGGWFYQYTSGNGGVAAVWFSERNETGAISCLRSKDLNDWELCGANNGFSVRLTRSGNKYDQWIYQNTWAPEVTYNEADKMFYMFYSAMAYDDARDDFGNSVVDYDALSPSNPLMKDLPANPFGVAVMRSASPVGPFELCTTEGMYGASADQHPSETVYENGKATQGTIKRNIGKLDFQIDIGRYYDLPYAFPVIDISPFEDEDGTKYLYFSKEYINNGNSKYSDSKDFVRNADGTLATDANGNYKLSDETYRYNVLSIWCMKMTDWMTPDYESLRMVAYPGKKSVEYVGGPVYEDSSYRFIEYANTEEEPYDDDGTLVEGAQMLAHKSADGKTRYYLTYSHTGFEAKNYGVHQAVSESPFGPFVKIGRKKSVLHTSVENDYMTGGGHHAFVEAEGELFCVYWVHCDPLNASLSAGDGRVYAVDRTFFTYDDALGYDILFANGPTNSLQPKPFVASGYRNVASEAKISIKGKNKDNIKWLTDGMFTTIEAFDDREYWEEDKLEITMKFKTPVDISAIMVYNSMYYTSAFSKIDGIVFELEEKPSWYTAADYNDRMYIKDLPFSERYYNATDGFMRQGGSAVASFNEMKVKEITITVFSKMVETNTKIAVSEIVVLGK